MAIKLPPSLKAADLKKLALQCGIASSGTKPVLTTRLLDECAVPRLPPSGQARVLSIDMGIRNLAYCVLDVPASKEKGRTRSNGTTSSSKGPSVKPAVLAWKRLSILSPSSSSSGNNSTLSGSSNDTDSSSLSDDLKKVPKESFHPSVLAAHAYTLLKTQLLPLQPTHVLIEQQRFRSSNSPTILEWTVRVNSLEAVLYGILHTLAAEGVWKGTVIPITPKRVGPFWVGEGESATSTSTANGNGNEQGDSDEQGESNGKEEPQKKKKRRDSKNAKVRNKGAKIDLVKAWLDDESHISMATVETQAMARAYLKRWYGASWKKVFAAKGWDMPATADKAEVEPMGKLDDLADSLLQGMAWLEWEKNKESLRRGDVDSVLAQTVPGKS